MSSLLGAGQALAQSAAAPLVPECPALGTVQLGEPGVETTLSGNHSFSGSYQVRGDLRLENGIFTFAPGTYVGVEGDYVVIKGIPRVQGHRLIVGTGAIIDAQQTTFSSGCNGSMWRGWEFDPTATGHAFVLNGCQVRNALFGVYVPSGSTSSYYNISNCTFTGNYYHFYDDGRHVQTELPAGRFPSTFSSNVLNAAPMLPPYNGTVGALPAYTTYEAIHMQPVGTPNLSGTQVDVRVGSNTIHGAVYGFVSTMPGRGRFRMDGGSMSGIRRIGLWMANQPESFPSTQEQTITLSGARTATAQTQASDRQYGVFAQLRNQDPNYRISVYGDNGHDTINYKVQTRQYIESLWQLNNFHTFNNLTYGLSIREGGAILGGLAFTNCWRGIRVLPNAGSVVDFAMSCNDFTTNIAGSRGIWLQYDNQNQKPGKFNAANEIAYGSIFTPVGNKFTGYNATTTPYGVNDLGNPTVRYSSALDAAENISSNDPLFQIVKPRFMYAGECSGRGNSFTGVQRGTSTRMQALQDTVRLQLAPAARWRVYAAEIRRHYVEGQQLPDLTTYILTLPTTNREAFFALGFDVLALLREQHRDAAALLLRTALAAASTTNPDATARLRYFDVVSRLNAAQLAPDQRPTAADSIALSELAHSGSAVAESANQWLAYYYPQAVRTQVAQRSESAVPADRIAASRIALFPNPAHDQLVVQMPSNTKPLQETDIRFVSLLNGQTMRSYALKVSATSHDGQVVSVAGLPAGTYAVQVWQAGRLVQTTRVVVQ